MSYRKQPADLPTSLGALRASRWGRAPLALRSVRDELRANLLLALRDRVTLFPGIHGYDDSIIPQLINALLARQDFILLGLRGQAKSRILRGLTQFLDEWLPIVAGSEVNDDPLGPISKYGRERIEAEGEATPVAWIHREDRYVEKLATPDVTIADLIGDLDPIRAARGGHVLSDELTMHFGSARRPRALGRAHDAFRAPAEGQPRHLRDQRAARPRGKDPGRAIQHHAGGRRPAERLSGATPPRRAAVLYREPGGLHGARQDHHTPQGPDRRRDHHALSARRRAGDGDYRARSLDRARWPGADGAGTRAGARSRRARGLRSAQRQTGGPPLRREPAASDQHVGERGLQHRAPGAPAGRAGSGQPDRRHLRGAAFDHRQAGTGVRGRAPGLREHRQGADSPGRASHLSRAFRRSRRRAARPDRRLVRSGLGAQARR